MDFSKASSQKIILDKKKCENECDITEGEQHKNNVKFNQRDTHLISQHDIKPVVNTINSLQGNNLGIVEKIPQYNYDETSQNSRTTSCSNIHEKKFITNQINDNARLTEDLTNKNTDNLMDNKSKMEDEEETNEKNSEMMEKSSKGKFFSKSKKRLQVLMRRNYPEQESLSSINFDTKLRLLPEEVKDINYKKIKYDNIKTSRDSRNLINNIPNSSPLNAAENEVMDDISNKSRFEEIEDKLEEMFAGIDDEKLVNITTDNKNLSKRNSEDLIDNYSEVNCTGTSKKSHINAFDHDGLKCDNPVIHLTKAAKKSTNSSPLLNINNQTICSSALLYLKTMHRRDSVNMETSNEEVNENKFNENTTPVNEKILPSQSLNSDQTKDTKKSTKYVRKNKIKNNRKKCSEFKNDINKKIIKNRNNKKNMCKTDTTNKSTILQNKIKQNHSSENENEERHLPVKDNETKHRSPFILVKNNGSIAVINTITADDSNEKSCRTKKNNNYVYERKTVKGCHSSTLSNRYDADTADSSWICVLCKIGPHQKKLGDLFGPYIITSDCDEYRSVKEFIEKYQMPHGTDTLFSNKSVKHIDEKSTSDIQKICKYNEEATTLNFTLGMSQISAVCYEIWIHEECAIWAPNLFVVGSRLAGLEDVTWSSIRYECVYCLKPGALLCCLQRDCKATSHVPCAREFNWLLDESKFWAYCGTHILK